MKVQNYFTIFKLNLIQSFAATLSFSVSYRRGGKDFGSLSQKSVPSRSVPVSIGGSESRFRHKPGLHSFGQMLPDCTKKHSGSAGWARLLAKVDRDGRPQDLVEHRAMCFACTRIVIFCMVLL